MTETRKLSDGERFRKAATVHGLAALALILGWAAADTWYVVTGLALANILSVISALVAAAWLSSILHEWGHFAGARLSKSYSPIVPEVRGIFMFGFKDEKNTRNQWLAMSLGGNVASWGLMLLVFFLIPLDNAGRAALFAMAFAKALSASLFEVPIIMKVMNGADSAEAVDEGLRNGSGDRGRVLGYLSGAFVWLIAS